MPSDLDVVLGCVAVRAVRYETAEDGRVTVYQPRFQRWPMNAFVRWLGRPDMRVRLDEVGSFMWDHCDGTRTVQQIAIEAKERFGPKVEPENERTALFFGQMARSGLVQLRRQEAQAPS